ncbi:hypothetical protein F5X99DRAFT_363893 [Biscogniauxia marginata]|nr:hypothetical protein F5X99DRAFT_363893 [Biscogniauxia marginata]
MASKTTIALITGANGGLGKAIATILAERYGYHVIIGSRNAANGTAVADALRGRDLSASAVQLDLTSDESISAAVERIDEEYGRLDVLVNNAAVNLEFKRDNTGLSTRELFTQTLQANLVGPAILTDLCLPLLERAEVPRIVFVSSRMGSMEHNLDRDHILYGVPMPAYKASKAGVNALGISYMAKLEPVGGMVNMVCPGIVNTKMAGFDPNGRPPEVAAEKVVELATLGKGGPTGTFVDADGPVPW